MDCNKTSILYAGLTILVPVLILIFRMIWKTEGRKVCLEILGICSLIFIGLPIIIFGLVLFYRWLLC